MKRVLFAIFCIMALCSLLLVNAGTIKAAEPGYVRTAYFTSVMPTIDGAWTSETEWTDGEVTMVGEDGAFTTTWDLGGVSVTTRLLVEFFSDNTTDAGDYWQICFDGDQSGGTAPQASDFRIDIVGHTTLTVYEGTGSGWTVVTTPSGIEWYNTVSDSPTNSTSHWILEMTILNNAVALSQTRNFRLAVYDDNSTAGVLAWPPTDRDVPNVWGIEYYSQNPIPESFGIAVFVILSSVAVVVSFFFLRKRSKAASFSSRKTGEINYT
jgi:hypothetical protein